MRTGCFSYWKHTTQVFGEEALLEQLRACRLHAMRGRNFQAQKLLREVMEWQSRSSAMFPPNAYTPLMYTLGKLGRVEGVLQMFWAMQAGGHPLRNRENNIVIHALAINGELALAERFWRSRQAESVDAAKAWDSIVRGAARSQNLSYEAVQRLVRKMTESGFALSPSVVDTLVMALIRDGRREEAWDLLMRAKAANCPSIEAFSRLLYAFGMARDKRRVVDMVEMIVAGEFPPDKKTFTIAYTWLARLQLRTWILDVYRAMMASQTVLDGRVLNAALAALAKAAPEKCFEVVREIRARHYRIQRSAWRAVISGSGRLRRNDLVMEAYWEYNKQPECFFDHNLFSAVVCAAAASGDLGQVCNLFIHRKEQLLRHGLPPMTTTPAFNGLLMAMLNGGYPAETLLRDVLEFAENHGEPNAATYNIALSSLLGDRSVNWKAVNRLLDIASDKEYCYNRLLEWHSQNRNRIEASRLRDKMAKEGVRLISPARITYAPHLRNRKPYPSHAPYPPHENPTEIGSARHVPEQVIAGTPQIPEREIEDMSEVPWQSEGISTLIHSSS